MESITAYLDGTEKIVSRIRETQCEVIAEAAEICAQSIASGGLVHLFGSGHSRVLVEEMYPRYGSFPGFHPIVELSLTYHNQVVGANGQRQAMFLERVEGFGAVIMRNFVFVEPDCFLIFSNSGVNEVVVEVALEAKKRGLPVLAVVSMDHSQISKVRHSSGKRLSDISDLTIDTCNPAGDALVEIPGLDTPVGPGSTVGGAVVTNALKVAIAERLTELGQPPIVLTSSYFVGEQASQELFEASYNDYRARVQRVYGCG
jgi:uncharacterized phosphosugar-binding protein